MGVFILNKGRVRKSVSSFNRIEFSCCEDSKDALLYPNDDTFLVDNDDIVYKRTIRSVATAMSMR